MEYVVVVLGLALALAFGFALGLGFAALGVHGMLARSGMRLEDGRIVREADAALDAALAARFAGNGGREGEAAWDG